MGAAIGLRGGFDGMGTGRTEDRVSFPLAVLEPVKNVVGRNLDQRDAACRTGLARAAGASALTVQAIAASRSAASIAV